MLEIILKLVSGLGHLKTQLSFYRHLLTHYRQLIQETLTSYTKIPYAHGDIQFETVFDQESDRYLVMILGRENLRRVHGCLIHVDIMTLLKKGHFESK